MAIDIKTIICPQCGSSDINMISETRGLCEVCGTQFTLQQNIETQNVYNEYYVNLGNDETPESSPCVKGEVIPEYTKDQFIRAAWIRLVKEDAPLEIFNEDFSTPCEKEHQVFIDSISVDVTYQASVGYDREEPYIDYEYYWEDVPYVVIEQKYNGITQKTENVEVTKYKKVKKQRQVTKYKKVTDWSALNGNHHTKSVAIVENKKGQHLNEVLFVDSFRGVKEDSVLPASAELSQNMQVTDAAQERATSRHRDQIRYSVKNALPGDHNKDLDWEVSKITASSSSLYRVLEYETSICFNGKTYIKHAFPFGPMNIGGDKIQNEVSLDAVTRKMRAELNAKNEARKNEIETNIAKATNKISLITIGILLASILVSLLIRSTAFIVMMFTFAVAAFVFNTIKVKKESKAEEKRAEDEIATASANTEEEIANYSKNYKLKQHKVLNDKLVSLGYEPASAREL